MMEKLGGRKFVGFMAVALMLFVLVLASKIDAGQFVTFITANLGIYSASNVVKAATEKK